MSREEYKGAIEVSIIFHEGQRMFAVPKQVAQQEPVAILFGTLPVYDTSPAQRTWVGLTDEERDDLLDNYITAEGRARAIEAKLKEKNT